MTKRTWILLVEDNANDADLAMRALNANQSPEEIVHANNGEEAMDCLRRQGAYQARDKSRPLLVLLDLKMPKVDGFEVLQQVKETAELKTIPVVVFSSSCERSDLVRCYQLGANAYVVKPVLFQEYVDVLRGVKHFWINLNQPPPVDDTTKVSLPQGSPPKGHVMATA
jgi:CheY-like chemotaxis protein